MALSTSLKRLQEEKISQARKKFSAKRTLTNILAGTAIALAAGSGYFYRKEITAGSRSFIGQSTFEDARRFHQYRQQFLDNLLKGIEIPFCDGVIYDDGKKIINYYRTELKSLGITNIAHIIGPTLKDLEGGDYDMKTPDIYNVAGQKRHTKIFVGKRVFDPRFNLYRNKEEVKAAILGHEAMHVDQHANWVEYLPLERILEGLDKKDINPGVIYILAEYDATARELNLLLQGKFKVSPEYIRERKKAFIEEGHKLTLYSRNSSPLQKEMIMNAHQAIYNRFPELRDVSIGTK